VQELCTSRAIYATGQVVAHEGTTTMLRESGIKVQSQERSLPGVAHKVQVFEIP
jgi:hypothetical protein